MEEVRMKEEEGFLLNLLRYPAVRHSSCIPGTTGPPAGTSAVVEPTARTTRFPARSVLPAGYIGTTGQQLVAKLATQNGYTRFSGTSPVPSSVEPTKLYTGRYYRLCTCGTTGGNIESQKLSTEWLHGGRRYHRR